MKLANLFLISTLIYAVPASAAGWGMEQGTPDITSAGALAFGPGNVLLIGDTKSAAVFAIDTGTTAGDSEKANINISDLAGKISSVVGGKASINDMAAHPETGVIFLSVTASGKPAIVQIDGAGKVSKVSLNEVEFSKAVLADAPEDKATGQGRRRRNNRADVITDLAFFEGKVLVSGLRSKGAPSSVRELDFPFAESDRGIGVQIYHAAHGKEEEYSAMRTFVPLMIDGKPNLLGAYVCTPLIKFPLDALDSADDKVKATTVAELGNRNRPLDMIRYDKDGAEFLLLSNSARGVMKISTAGLTENKGLTKPVRGGGVAGQGFETVDSMSGVVQMDKLNETHAVVLVDHDGSLDLKTVALP
ncbi:MAG: hypothetical protein ABJZ55_06970 [Fuerstiella sp.]